MDFPTPLSHPSHLRQHPLLKEHGIFPPAAQSLTKKAKIEPQTPTTKPVKVKIEPSPQKASSLGKRRQVSSSVEVLEIVDSDQDELTDEGEEDQVVDEIIPPIKEKSDVKSSEGTSGDKPEKCKVYVLDIGENPVLSQEDLKLFSSFKAPLKTNFFTPLDRARGIAYVPYQVFSSPEEVVRGS